MSDQISFGSQLKRLRNKSTDPLNGRALSQERLAELLSDKTRRNYNHNTIGAWENGKSEIDRKDRVLLLALLKVLIECECTELTGIGQADGFLKSGYYLPLSKAEAEELFPLGTGSGIYPPTLFPPDPSRIFIGHQELLRRLKKRFSGSPAIVALVGTLGSGKTSIASQLVCELQDNFKKENIFWSSLQDYGGNHRPILLALGHACEPDFEASPDDKNLKNDVRRLLEERQDKNGSLLIVIDKVYKEEWVKAAQAIKDAIPVKASILILVRNKDIAIELGAAVELVPALSDEEAIEMFAYYAQRDISGVEKEIVRKLIQAVDHLPILIKLAGKKLQTEVRPGYGLVELLSDINQQTIIRTLEGGLVPLLTISYQDLEMTTKKIFRWVGVFAQGPIRLNSIIDILGLPAEELEEHLHSLVRRSMLKWDERSDVSAKRIIIHPLLREYARALLIETGEWVACRQAHLRYYLEYAVKNAQRKKEAYALLESALPNLDEAIEWAITQKNQEALKQFGFALCNDSLFLSMRGYAQRALNLLPEAAKACHALEERGNEAMMLGNWGRALQYVGQIGQAIECYQQATQLSHDTGGRAAEAVWLEHLWLIYRDSGEFDLATHCAERALSIHRELGDQRRADVVEGHLSQDRWDYRIAIQRYEEALSEIQNTHKRLKIICLTELGLVYRHLGQVQKSIEYFKEALQICQETGNLKAEGDIRNDLGLAHYNLGKIEESVECFEKALVLSRQTHNQLGEANALGNLGLAYRHYGNYEVAIEKLNEALVICRKYPDRRSEANALANLGITYRYLGKDYEAITCHEQALEIRKIVHDLRGEGASYGNLGISYLNLGHLEKAIRYLEASLKISWQVGERRSEGNALDHLGHVYYHQGEIEKAIDYFEQALAISEEIGHERSKANRLALLGDACRLAGNRMRGLDLLNQALELSIKIKDRRAEARCLEFLGLFVRGHDNQLARDYLDKAMEVARELKNRRGEGDILGHLGTTYYFDNDFKRAIGFYDQALMISREVDDRWSEGNHLLVLGVAWRRIYQSEKALDFYQKALTIQKEIGNRRAEAMLHNNMGNVYRDLGNLKLAENCYAQAQVIYTSVNGLRAGLGNTLKNIGILQLDLYQKTILFDKVAASTDHIRGAIECLEQAVTIARETEEKKVYVLSLGYLAIALSIQGNKTRAVDLAHQALKSSQELNDLQLEGQQFGVIGAVHFHLNQPHEAVVFLEKALESGQKSADPGEIAKVLDYLGQTYQLLGEGLQAVQCFDTGLQYSTEINHGFLAAKLHKNLANYHFDQMNKHNELAGQKIKELSDSLLMETRYDNHP